MTTFAPELFRVSNSIKVNLLHKTQLKQLWQQIYKAYGSELNSFCYEERFKNKRKTLNLSSLRCKKRKGYLS